MLQMYKIFVLFVIVLNSFLFNSCQCGTDNQRNENNMKESKELIIGSPAPLFTLPDMNGKPVNLKDFIGQKSIVLYFYPKDDSYGCTKEACSFRDAYQDFKDAGAEVIGISTDSQESHKAFAANHRLPFILLSDPDGAVTRLYGVKKTLGILKGRVTFLIDKKGNIRLIYSSQINYEKHISEALEMLRRLKAEE
jgi:thioredoxin-dependent peroxiredoxin